jgi:hypothetical protein
VVMVQRPGDMDTACTLALLQEEVSEPVRRKDWPRGGLVSWAKSGHKGPFPLPSPPTGDKPLFTAPDKRIPGQSRSMEDKMTALRAYRRAKGLCDRCAKKWHRGTPVGQLCNYKQFRKYLNCLLLMKCHHQPILQSILKSNCFQFYCLKQFLGVHLQECCSL